MPPTAVSFGPRKHSKGFSHVTFKTSIAALFLAAASVVGFAATASAQVYSVSCSLSSTGAVVPNGQIQVSGSGFEPNLATSLTFTDADSTETLGPIAVGATGTFGPSAFTLPASITGSVTLSAVCDSEDPGDPATTVLGVVITTTTATTAAVNNTAALPRTGDNSTEPLATAGAAAVALGAGIVLVARRRRRAAA